MLIFITDRKRHMLPLAEALRKSGIYLLHTSLETALFTCDKKDTGAVLLDCIPSYRKAEGICEILRHSYPALPIAVIVPEGSITSMLADRILYETAPEKHLSDVLDFCRAHGFGTERLSASVISVDEHGQNARYLGYPLELPPRAAQLLHCLIYRYPHPTTPDDLMSLCFPEEGLNVSNLTVTVHAINRAAAKISPYPLVLNLRDGGYVLSPYEKTEKHPSVPLPFP